MGIGSSFKKAIGNDRVDGFQQQVKRTLTQGLEKHISIAVTGLSRSGKTVFITALTQHLLNAHRSTSLPFLSAVAESRIISVKCLADDTHDAFPIAESISALQQEPPLWPVPSTDLRTIRLAIRYRPRSRLRTLFSEASTLYLDLIDYPGEWLLDLPLLQMDFKHWCQFQQQLLTEPTHASRAKEWLTQRNAVNWQQPVSQEQLRTLTLGYKALLDSFRNDGFSLLQPGRLVLPDHQQSNSLPYLFPLSPDLSATATDEKTSGYETLEANYYRYRDEQIKPFYRQHFSQFDRQIVLVDCLKALNQGKACFDDMQLALTTVLKSFSYGKSSLLRRLFKPRIDRVLFAATKADHVTPNQHHNLDRFMQLVIDAAQRELTFEGIETQCLALSSVRSTELALAKVDGQQLSCLRGFDKHSNEEIALFPGEIPTELPTVSDWSSDRFQFVDFAPKRLPQQTLLSEHHIRLDQALEFLIGDSL